MGCASGRSWLMVIWIGSNEIFFESEISYFFFGSRVVIFVLTQYIRSGG